jgi:hypothetical protein
MEIFVVNVRFLCLSELFLCCHYFSIISFFLQSANIHKHAYIVRRPKYVIVTVSTYARRSGMEHMHTPGSACTLII